MWGSLIGKTRVLFLRLRSNVRARHVLIFPAPSLGSIFLSQLVVECSGLQKELSGLMKIHVTFEDSPSAKTSGIDR